MTRSSAEQYKFRKAVYLANVQTVSGRPTLVCYLCGFHIDPAKDAWIAEHVIPHAFDGKDGAVACVPCAKHKTAKTDIPAISKSKRASDKHLGIRRKGWGGKWKKKMSGETVER